MDELEILRITAAVKGRVQGVGFRQFVYDIAQRLSLSGYVKNDRYNSQRLELVAEGDRSRLQTLEENLRRGPAGARVTAIDIEWDKATGTYNRFEILY